MATGADPQNSIVPIGTLAVPVGGTDGTYLRALSTDANGNVSLTSNTTSAVTKVTAGGAGPGQSIKTFSSSGGVSIATGATTISYTVTTGKTLYITDIDVSTSSATAVLVQIKAGSTVIAERYISTTNSWSSIGIESQPTVGSAIVMTLVFGTSSGSSGAYFIGGYEQ